MEVPKNNEAIQILIAERVDKKPVAPQHRTVNQIRLRGHVRYIEGNECRIRLSDNNGFDRDNREVTVPLDMVKPLSVADNVTYHREFGIPVKMKGTDKRLKGQATNRINWRS